MWILLLAASLAIGATFIRLFRFPLTKLGFWMASTIIGFVLTAVGGLALSYLMGFSVTSQLLLCTIYFIVAALANLRLPKITYDDTPTKRNTARGWLIVLALIVIGVGIMTLTQRDGGLYINNRHNYGDIRLHISYINNFLYGENIPVQNPIFSGTAPSYPFLINFLSAQFVLLGLPLTFVINGMTVLGMGLIGGMLWQLSQYFFNHKGVATWTLMIFFLGGGLGIMHLWPEWSATGWSSTYWHTLTHDFSMYQDKGYWFSNVIISFLSTQRSLLIGMPLTLFILYQLFRLRLTSDWRHYLGTGLLIGLLPIIHTSSTIIVGIFTVFIGIRSLSIAWKEKQLWAQVQKWLIFAIPALVIGLFLVHTFIGQTGSVSKYIRFSSNWMADDGAFIPFWFKNAGILIGLTIAGLIWLKHEKNEHTELLSYSYIIFIVFNFIIMQAWSFDNAKYLIYWFVFACMLGAYALMHLWEQKRKLLTTVLIILLLASGTVDLVRRIVVPEMKIQVASARDLKLVEELRAIIPPKAIVLTYGSVTNPVVDYLGRRMVYGDNAWLWSHSIDHEPRYADIQNIYAGDITAPQLLDTLNVDYIIVSDNERMKFTGLNEAYFAQNYQPVFTSTTHRLAAYKVTRD